LPPPLLLLILDNDDDDDWSDLRLNTECDLGIWLIPTIVFDEYILDERLDELFDDDDELEDERGDIGRGLTTTLAIPFDIFGDDDVEEDVGCVGVCGEFGIPLSVDGERVGDGGIDIFGGGIGDKGFVDDDTVVDDDDDDITFVCVIIGIGGGGTALGKLSTLGFLIFDFGLIVDTVDVDDDVVVLPPPKRTVLCLFLLSSASFAELLILFLSSDVKDDSKFNFFITEPISVYWLFCCSKQTCSFVSIGVENIYSTPSINIFDSSP